MRVQPDLLCVVSKVMAAALAAAVHTHEGVVSAARTTDVVLGGHNAIPGIKLSLWIISTYGHAHRGHDGLDGRAEIR